jgi:serine/threonine protein phosphatase PrpC
MTISYFSPQVSPNSPPLGFSPLSRREDLFHPSFCSLVSSPPVTCEKPRLATFAKNPPLSLLDAQKRMERNAVKAMFEHWKEAPDEPWVSEEEAVERGRRDLPKAGLHLYLGAAEARGRRHNMEDRYCHISKDEGSLVALFDGHAGAEVSTFCQIRIKSLFFECLKEFSGSPHAAFQHTFDRLEQEIHKNKLRAGTTAVVSFIDHKLWKIFTATIGDSEATLYQQSGEGMKVLPLSCLRNWKSPKDLARWKAVDESVKDLENPKHMYYPKIKPKDSHAVNLSRALGDFSCKIPCHKTSALIHKCKITVQNLTPGDLVILACDGLKDFVKEREVVSVLSSQEAIATVPKALVDYAINQGKSQDNVTVVALRILDKLEESASSEERGSAPITLST